MSPDNMSAEQFDMFGEKPVAPMKPVHSGWQGAINGAQRAVEHADRVSDGEWSATANKYVQEYLRSLPHGETFTSVQAREWMENKGCPVPPSRCAWGAIWMTTRKSGAIAPHGFTNANYANSKNTHTQAVRVWRVVRGGTV